MFGVLRIYCITPPSKDKPYADRWVTRLMALGTNNACLVMRSSEVRKFTFLFVLPIEPIQNFVKEVFKHSFLNF